MDSCKLCDSEYKFMNIVWESSPVNSGVLVKLCSEKLGWKKSTTYTVIKRLCERGFIKNEKAVITNIIPMEKVQLEETEYFVDRTFNGSISRLVSAFLDNGKISENEAEELKRLIDGYMN